MRSSNEGQTETVFKLLKHDKLDCLNDQDRDGWTALVLASSGGYSDIVVESLKHSKVNVDHQTKDSETALTLASFNGHANIVWELLKHDPCVVLEWTTTKGHSEIVRCLEHTLKASRYEDDEKQRFDTTDQPARKQQHRVTSHRP